VEGFQAHPAGSWFKTEQTQMSDDLVNSSCGQTGLLTTVSSLKVARGGDSREKAGLTAGGIYKVITHLGLFGFEPTTRRMCLEALHPGASVEEVTERTDFEMLIPDEIQHTQPPTEEELRILRELDPDQRYTGAKEE